MYGGNFSQITHGKGAEDGMGGEKSAVNRIVVDKNGPVVQCAGNFFRLEVKKSLPNVKWWNCQRKSLP